MSYLVHGHDGICLDWLLQREPMAHLEAESHAIGIVDGAGVLKGCITLTWMGWHTVAIGIESEGVLTRRVIRGTFAFVFQELGAARCEMLTKRTNKVMKKHAPTTLGFRFEGVRRDWYGQGVDALAYYMTPATCKWIEHGKPILDAQAA